MTDIGILIHLFKKLFWKEKKELKILTYNLLIYIADEILIRSSNFDVNNIWKSLKSEHVRSEGLNPNSLRWVSIECIYFVGFALGFTSIACSSGGTEASI